MCLLKWLTHDFLIIFQLWPVVRKIIDILNATDTTQRHSGPTHHASLPNDEIGEELRKQNSR